MDFRDENHDQLFASTGNSLPIANPTPHSALPLPEATRYGELTGNISSDASALSLAERQSLSQEQLQDSRSIPPTGCIATAPLPHAVCMADSVQESVGMAIALPTGLHLINTIPNLPTELIFKILTYLPWREIVGCRLVCRWLRDEVDQSVRFQYQIALALSAMENGPTDGPLSTVDRLRLLNVRQHAWRNLAWRKIVTFTVPFGAPFFFDLVGGILGIGPLDGSQILHYVQFPTVEEVENGVELGWSHVNLPFKITDFAMDIEQDLLILIELPDDSRQIRFHFLMLSTHAPHPAASRCTLEHPCESPTEDEFNVHIIGSHIGVLFPSSTLSEGGQLVIYSWTTGHTRAYVEPPPGGWLRSFTFLSSSAFIIPWETTIDLYSFDLESTVEPTPQLRPLLSFHFPERCRSSFHFDCRAYPYPRSDLSHLESSGIPVPPFAPFYTDPEDGIIHFWLGDDLPESESPNLAFVVHRSALLSYLENWDDSQVTNIDWDDWGPKNTRWFERYRYPIWNRTVHGHRLVMMEPAAGNNPSEFIRVIDLNPVKVLEALTRSVASDLVTAHTTIAGGLLFKTDIVSELPYLEARIETPLICSRFIIDDQRILLMQKDNGNFEASVLLL